MRKHTNHALFLSFVLHIGLILGLSPFLVNPFEAEKESISAEILEVDAKKQVKRQVLQRRSRLIAKATEGGTASNSPAAPTYAPRVTAPKAPVQTDIVPDVVTHTDLPKTDRPSAVSNASFGEEQTLGGPVVIQGQNGRGTGGTGVGFGGPNRQGSSIGMGLASGMGATEAGLDIPIRIDTGLGIFGTVVKPGHGLVGQVYVPGGAIYQMPNFDSLVPINTFVTANLDVPVRNYTAGFPTPDTQSVVENFAIRFRAELEINIPGTYTFELRSDDGSQLYIDGTLVVDNDGIHPTMSRLGGINLSTGIHPVEIHYFQGPRHAIALQWFYQPPNGTRQIVPPDIIHHPGEPEIPDALKKLQQRLKKVKE